MGTAGNLSKEEVAEKLAAGIPYVIRQKMPTEGTTSFQDEVYGLITVDNDTLDDQVLIKADGMPTYNFANVVDDHTMGLPMSSVALNTCLLLPNITCCTRRLAGRFPLIFIAPRL